MGFSLAKLPVFGGLFDDTEDRMQDQLDANRAIYNGIELPEFEKYDPVLYEYAGDYSPEEAKYQTISEDPMLRSAQMSALSKLAGLASSGLSAQDEAAYNRARSEAGRIAKSGTQSALQNAQMRGVAGGGMEFAMRQMAGQDAAERAQQAALDQAAKGADMRALYQQAYGNALSGVRGEDYRANSANADIINRFNQMNTQERNRAQGRNLEARQNIGNANADTQNAAVRYRNTLAQLGFQNQLKKAGGQSGVNDQFLDFYAAQNAANEQKRKAYGKAIGGAIGGSVGGPQGASAGGSIGESVGNFF